MTNLQMRDAFLRWCAVEQYVVLLNAHARRYSASDRKRMKRKKKRSIIREPLKHNSGVCKASTYPVSKTHWLYPASCVLLSIIAAIYFGAIHAKHAKQLHENELWFSHITVSLQYTGLIINTAFSSIYNANVVVFMVQQVEQEISFRTEAGLYYSYYKQLIQASTMSEGMST